MDWASFTIGALVSSVIAFAAASAGLSLVIKRQFLAWISARMFAIGLLALTLPPLGAYLFGDPDGRLIARLAATDVSIAMVGPVMATYLERALPLPRVRALFWSIFPIGLGLALCAPLFAQGILPLWLHSALVLGLIVMLVTGLVRAIRAGSRPAIYQAVAWGPAILLGFVAVYSELVLLRSLPFYGEMMLAALMFELIVTPIGIGDGFRVVRRERDLALANMREATRANALDPLTGIANRRGLERQFSAPSTPRPRGIALIDCDHFKRINDGFGHDTGDEALVAVANALVGENAFAARLGGEEFVLLLYGETWQRDAEAARRRIAPMVAHRVPALPFALTASAGLAEILEEDSLYTAVKRADRALYAAKDAGRDRAISLTDFHRHLTRLEEIG